MASKINRRQFVKHTTAAGVGFHIANRYAGAAPTQKDENKKLNLAVIGCGGRGHSDLSQVAGENIVALVDVDHRRAEQAFGQYPNAKKYIDFREMYDKHGKDLDGVVVATPDHMHAPAAMMGMKLGLHCYCEKPLTWSIGEARALTEIAAKNGLATQMGNQGAASPGFRNGVQLMRDGVLGEVKELHVWTNRPVWPQAIEAPSHGMPAPDGLDWDLWQGVAKHRPYHEAYLPFNWRGWYDYGTGALGDMACHTMHLPYLGLKLGAPTSVVAQSSKLFSDSFPATSKVTYQFPARDGLAPVTMYWYDGNPAVTPDRHHPPAGLVPDDVKLATSGAIIVGGKGTMYSPDDYGGKYELFPRAKFANLPRPRSELGYVRGHHHEWLMACRGQGTPVSNFAHAGPFTEMVLLGVLALRTGKTINWDAPGMTADGVPEAQQLIHREYHNGYTL